MFEPVKIAPSILSADFMHLGRDIELIEKAGAGYVHVDVMDGHFVPLFGFNQPQVRQLTDWNRACGDVHLMAELTQTMLEECLKLPLQNRRKAKIWQQTKAFPASFMLWIPL